MKPILTPISVVTLALAGFTFPVGNAFAGTLAVGWGGDYVAQSEALEGINGDTVTGLDLDGDSMFDDSITGRAFNESVPWSPSAGYSGTSATFYGGGAVGQLDGPSDGWEEAEVQNHGPDDDIHFHVHSGGHFHDFHAVIYWDKLDFINGLDVVPGISLDDTSEISLTVSPDTGGHSTSGMADAQGRWLIREGSSYFLSETTFVPALGGGGSDDGVRTLSGFTTTSDGNWTSYSPSGLNLHFDTTAAVYSPQNFSDITGIGFLIDNDSFGDNPYDWHFEGFSANVVPEPSGPILLILGLAGLLARRGRR